MERVKRYTEAYVRQTGVEAGCHGLRAHAPSQTALATLFEAKVGTRATIRLLALRSAEWVPSHLTFYYYLCTYLCMYVCMYVCTYVCMYVCK